MHFKVIFTVAFTFYYLTANFSLGGYHWDEKFGHIYSTGSVKVTFDIAQEWCHSLESEIIKIDSLEDFDHLGRINLPDLFFVLAPSNCTMVCDGIFCGAKSW